MRCISLGELLFFISICHISKEMKDILEEIQTSDDNPSDLNAFFEDVMKFKKAFKMIRRAAAETEEDGVMSGDRIDKDVDEYVYDEDNFVANTKKVKDEKLASKNNKNHPLHKSNRPLNDIYPHIYKGHPDQEYADKYFDNLNFDKGPRYRRQLVEDVQVEPQSTKGNIAVIGEKATMVNTKNKAELMENEAHETLMTIFNQLGKTTHPAHEGTTPNTNPTPSPTETFNSQKTLEGPVSIFLTTISPLDFKSTPVADSKTSVEVQKEKNKRELKIDIIKDGKVVKEYSPNENENIPCASPKQTSISLNIVQPANIVDSKKDLTSNENNNFKDFRDDLGHFRKFESVKTPSEIGSNYPENIPKFVGNVMDELQSNYRRNAAKMGRPNYYYGPYMQPIYSEDPRRAYYRNFQNMMYNKPYYEDEQQNGDEENEEALRQPQEGVNIFRSRNLKFINDSEEDLARFERSVQEILGMDNEDDYTEDLAFKTESPSTIKYAEEDDEISPARTFVKSKIVEAEMTQPSSTDDQYITTTPARILTTTSSPLHDESTVASTTTRDNIGSSKPRKKRTRKYRKIKNKKLLSRFKKRCKPCEANEGKTKKKRLAEVDIDSSRLEKERNHNQRCPEKFHSHQNKYYYPNNAWCNNLNPYEMYQKLSYLHLKPCQSMNHYFYGDVRRKRNSSKCNCACCRKLMSKTNEETKNTIQKRDVIDGMEAVEENDLTYTKKKRTESDYGDEPDLSEGQNFKKHTKLKKHNKVMAPSKNFEDNYEYEEVPNDKKDGFLGYGKNCNHKKKCKKKKKFKLKKADHHSCQVSFRDRLARLKDKLFSSQPDEIEKALREEIPYSGEYDESRRSERQSEPTSLHNQDDGSPERAETDADADNKRCCIPCCNPPDPCNPLFPPCQPPCSPPPCPCDPGPPIYDSSPCQPCCPSNMGSSSSDEPLSNFGLPYPPVSLPCEPCTCPMGDQLSPSFPHPYQPYPCPIHGPFAGNPYSDIDNTDRIESHVKERCPSIYPYLNPCTSAPPCPCPYPPPGTFSPPMPYRNPSFTASGERKYDERNADDDDSSSNDDYEHSINRRSYYMQKFPDFKSFLPYSYNHNPFEGRDFSANDQSFKNMPYESPSSYPYPYPIPSSACPCPASWSYEPSPCPEPSEPCPYPYYYNLCPGQGPIPYRNMHKRHVEFNYPSFDGRYPPFCCDSVLYPCPCPATCPCPPQYPCPIPCPYVHPGYNGEGEGNFQDQKFHDIRERMAYPCSSPYPDPSSPYPFSLPVSYPCSSQIPDHWPFPFSFDGQFEGAGSAEEKNLNSRNAQENNSADSNESDKHKEADTGESGFSNCPPCSYSIYIEPSISTGSSDALPPAPYPPPYPPNPPTDSTSSSSPPSSQSCSPCPPAGQLPPSPCPPCTPSSSQSNPQCPPCTPSCPPCPAPMQPPQQTYPDPCEPQNPDYDDNENSDMYKRNERSKLTNPDAKRRTSKSSESETDFSKKEDKDKKRSPPCHNIPLSNPCFLPCPLAQPCSSPDSLTSNSEERIREKRSDIKSPGLKNNSISNGLNEGEPSIENKPKERQAREGSPKLPNQDRHSEMGEDEESNSRKSRSYSSACHHQLCDRCILGFLHVPTPCSFHFHNPFKKCGECKTCEPCTTCCSAGSSGESRTTCKNYPCFHVPCGVTYHIPCPCSHPGKRSEDYSPCDSYTVFFFPMFHVGESTQNDINRENSRSENEDSRSNQDGERSTAKESKRVKREWDCPHPKLSRSNCFMPPHYHGRYPESRAYSNPSADFGAQDPEFSLPPRYWNIHSFGPHQAESPNNLNRLTVHRRSNMLHPNVNLPSSASASDLIDDPGFDDADIGKRKCPKSRESLPLYTAHPPPPLPLPCDDTTNDMMAQRVRQVNEYLKNQYLNGRYTMNNQNVPLNRRQSPLIERERCTRMEPLERLVRRPHGVPKKPSNRRLPTQNEDLEHLQNLLDDNKFSGSKETHKIIKRKNAEMEDENNCQREKVDRRHCKSRAVPVSESKSKEDLNPEDFMLNQKKSNSEFQDLHFAKEIVEAVMDKVNKNANLKIKIGNALNKKRIYETENSQRNFAKANSFEEKEEYEEAKNLLNSVSCVMNKLVKKQIEEKLCEKLPGHLKNFLKRIVRPPKHRINQRHDDRYHEDTFLFRASCPSAKLNPHMRNKLEGNMVKLLDRYNQLDDDSKKRAAPVKSYISNHLDMLKKIEEENYDTETPALSPEGYLEENESSQTKMNSGEPQLETPLNSMNNLDFMEKDLEDLEKKEKSFQQPPFGVNNFPEEKMTEEENSIDNKLKKRNTDTLKEKLPNKRQNKEDLTSDKYKKLVKAAEEVRIKRKNEEKIREVYGKKKVDENEQEDQVAFETPLVYRT